MEFTSEGMGSLCLHFDCSLCVQIYAKEAKDIPDWMKASQNWQNAVPVEKLQVTSLCLDSRIKMVMTFEILISSRKRLTAGRGLHRLILCSFRLGVFGL